MSKLKEIEIYNAISESEKIQELIRRIANKNTDSSVRTDNRETERLQSQITVLQSQLQQAEKSLEQYKNFYVQSKPRLEENEHLHNEVENLKSKESEYKTSLQKKSSEIENIKDALDASEKNCKNLLSELKTARDTADQLKKQFDTPINFFNMYKELSYSTRSGLENVISDKNEITFIVSCSDEDNLSAIWKYAKDISGDSDSNDFSILSRIFDYFFDVFNDSRSEPKYIRDDVETGDYFDDEYHDRFAGSATSGDISEIILRGYKSVNTGRIIHKSLVKV